MAASSKKKVETEQKKKKQTRNLDNRPETKMQKHINNKHDIFKTSTIFEDFSNI